MTTEPVLPTCVVKAGSVKSLISSVSGPSVRKSLAMALVKENCPLGPTLPEPLRMLGLKSAAVIPVPDTCQ